MGKYFGTDGFRGRANVQLTAIHAFRVGRFLGRYFSKGKDRARIVVGKDTRRSSYTLEYSLAAGATASGADVYLLHVTTTPSVAYLTRTEGFDCGVMISASHNPFDDNGIKLFSSSGEKLGEGILRLVEDFLDGGTLPLATGEDVGRTVDFVTGRSRYLAYLLSLPQVGFRGMRIGLDCANGSAFMIAKAVFDALGAEVSVIGATPDGTNINAGVGSTHPEALRRLVQEKSLDAGFAFDGDADRCIAVDEKGNLLAGDAILWLFAHTARETGGGIVTTPMSNSALGKVGVPVFYSEVGDRFVYEEMVRRGSFLGGESSGHIIFRKFSTTGDGILTALKLMELSVTQKTPLSVLAEGFHPLPQIFRTVFVKDRGILSSERAKEAIREAERLLGGRVYVRASGTESAVRILCEGEGNLEEAANRIERALVSEVL